MVLVHCVSYVCVYSLSSLSRFPLYPDVQKKPTSPSHFKPIETAPNTARRLSSLTDGNKLSLDEYLNKVTEDKMKVVLDQLKTERYENGSLCYAVNVL